MRFSLWADLGRPWSDVLALARLADGGGWDTIYVEDHFVPSPPAQADPLLEATAVLSAVAAVTERVRLGTLVLSVTYRHPAVIANWAAAVDQVSDGRLTLGLGAGWQEPEHAAYGLRLGPPRERVDRFEEGLRVVRGLLTTPTTTLTGQYYALTDARCEPKPVQRPVPLLIGAKGDRMLGLVAAYADQWNLWASPELLAERAAVLERHCERLGRDPATIHRSTQALLRVTDDAAAARDFLAGAGARPAIAGPVASVAEQVAAYRAVGLDEFIVIDDGFGTGARREDGLAALHEALVAADR